MFQILILKSIFLHAVTPPRSASRSYLMREQNGSARVRMCAESVGQRSKVLRKVEELKNALVCSGVPDEFLCPITRELMREPVLAAGEPRVFCTGWNISSKLLESCHGNLRWGMWVSMPLRLSPAISPESQLSQISNDLSSE